MSCSQDIRHSLCGRQPRPYPAAGPRVDDQKCNSCAPDCPGDEIPAARYAGGNEKRHKVLASSEQLGIANPVDLILEVRRPFAASPENLLAPFRVVVKELS